MNIDSINNFILKRNKYFIYLFPLFIVALLGRSFNGFSIIYWFVPVYLIGFSLYGLFNLKRLKWTFNSITFFLFGFSSLITSLWSDYPIVTLQRGLFFLLIVFGLVSALHYFKLNYSCIKFFFMGNFFVVVLSLVSLVFKYPADAWSGGNGKGFMGFASQQNVLGMALLFTYPGVIFCLFELILSLKNNKFNFIEIQKIDKRKKVFIILLFVSIILNFFLLLLTVSRASLLSFFLFNILILLYVFEIKKILQVVFPVALVFVLLFFISPQVKMKVDYLIFKGDNGILISRGELYKATFEGARQGGFFGLGYGVSIPGPIGSYENDRFIREKCSSPLAMVEEVGIIGLILFLIPLIQMIRVLLQNLKKKKDVNGAILLFALLAFFIHSQFEAWWVGISNFCLIIFILLILSFENES